MAFVASCSCNTVYLFARRESSNDNVARHDSREAHGEPKLSLPIYLCLDTDLDECC